MTLKDYYNLNLPTIKFCIKTSGLIFSSIVIIIYFLVYLKTNTAENPFYVFSIAIISGIVMSALIASLGFVTAYHDFKKIRKCYQKIPKKLISLLDIHLTNIPGDYRYNFIHFEIVGFNEESPFRITYNNQDKLVYLSILINFSHIENIEYEAYNISNKYKDQNIFLNGLGLTKAIRYKTWVKISENEIYMHLEKLYQILEEEKINPIKYYEALN